MLELQTRTMLSESTQPPSRIAAAESLLADCDTVWRFCAASRGHVLPTRFATSFGLSALELIVAHSRHDGRGAHASMVRLLLLRSLAAAGHASLPSTQALLSRLGLEYSSKASAQALLAASYAADDCGEALVFALAATVHAPTSGTLHELVERLRRNALGLARQHQSATKSAQRTFE